MRTHGGSDQVQAGSIAIGKCTSGVESQAKQICQKIGDSGGLCSAKCVDGGLVSGSGETGDHSVVDINHLCRVFNDESGEQIVRRHHDNPELCARTD